MLSVFLSKRFVACVDYFMSFTKYVSNRVQVKIGSIDMPVKNVETTG